MQFSARALSSIVIEIKKPRFVRDFMQYLCWQDTKGVRVFNVVVRNNLTLYQDLFRLHIISSTYIFYYEIYYNFI